MFGTFFHPKPVVSNRPVAELTVRQAVAPTISSTLVVNTKALGTEALPHPEMAAALESTVSVQKAPKLFDDQNALQESNVYLPSSSSGDA